MSNPADWRSYVKLSPDFTKDERVRMEAALDFIVQTSDGDGINLLQAASKNIGGKPIVIAPAIEGTGSFAAAYNGTIGIDFEEARRITIKDDGEKRPLSLDGILSHELYHIAQRPRNYESVRARTDAKVDAASTTGMLAEDPRLQAKVREEAHDYIDNSIDRTTAIRLRRNGETRKSLMRGAVEIRTLAAAMPEFTKNIEDIVEPSKNVDGSGTPQFEQEATLYTDALLAKNVPDAEQRRLYANGKMSKKERDDVTLLTATGQEYDSPGFMGTTTDLVITQSDGVNNNPYAHLLKDFKPAAGCSTDGQHYCNGDTGMLPAANGPVEKAKDGVILQ